MAILKADGLGKIFKYQQRPSGLGGRLRSLVAPTYHEYEAVRSISFSLEPGEVLAFIGPNGAGKSTTIKMLTGLLHPSSGSARVLGLIPWQQRRQLAYSISNIFGQKSQLWYHLPPRDTFDLLAHIYELDMGAFRKRRDFLIDVFDIAEFMSTPVNKLSLGERMRCELAAALLHKPRILFLDEPTIGLDLIAKQRIRDLISLLNTEEGVTVLLTSHDAGDVEQVCQRTIVINHGEIILDTSVAEMKRNYFKKKIVDLLLEEPAETLLITNAETGQKELNIEVPFKERESLEYSKSIKLIESNEHNIKIEIDITYDSLEPVLAAIMSRCHILDMTISDPPMEEIIVAIYGGKQKQEENCQSLKNIK